MTKLTEEQKAFILENAGEFTIKELSAKFDVRRTLIWSCLKTNGIKAKPARRNYMKQVSDEVVIDWDACSITGFKTF